jgi:hypothetical protein
VATKWSVKDSHGNVVDGSDAARRTVVTAGTSLFAQAGMATATITAAQRSREPDATVQIEDTPPS